MKRQLLLLISLLLSLSIAAQNNIQNYIDKLKEDTLFINSVTAILVTDSKGNEVASWNPDMPLMTASTLKTITTGVALQKLGPDFKYITTLAHSGKIVNGVLRGNLHIIGGGDPTLGSRDEKVSIGIGPDSLFNIWLTALQELGIKRIDGHIIADDTYFEGENIPTTWSWTTVGSRSGTEANGLNFWGNRQEATFISGFGRGEGVVLESLYPEIPGMSYQNNVITTSKRGRRSLNFRTTSLAKVAQFNGRLPAGDEYHTYLVGNKYPHLSCAFEFQKYLDLHGVYSRPEILDAKELVDSDKLTTVIEVESPPLHEIVRVTNKISNNLYAEVLFRTVAKMEGKSTSYSNTIKIFKKILSEEYGLDLYGYRQIDGSGLSRRNNLSPRFFCNFYQVMAERPHFDHFLNSLPVPGGEGTLERVLRKVKVKDKERLHAKSGSISNVRSYAGYVERKNGEMLYFAILGNNFIFERSKMQVGIEGFLEELTKY